MNPLADRLEVVIVVKVKVVKVVTVISNFLKKTHINSFSRFCVFYRLEF